jgi:kumamolisin
MSKKVKWLRVRYLYLASVLAILLSIVAPFGSVSFALAHSTPPTGVTVPLAGSDPVASRHGVKIGRKAASDQVEIEVALKLRNTAQLDQLLADLTNPASLRYRQYLTPSQFGANFGPTPSDADRVSDFLKSKNLSVSAVASDRTFVKATGTTAQVEAALGVTLNIHKNAKGEIYFANAEAPSIPVELSGIILAIHGLDNEPNWHHTHNFANQIAHAGSGPGGGYTPGELRTAYDVGPLINTGYSGQNQKVALFELDGFDQANINQFNGIYGYSLFSPVPSTVLVDNFNGHPGFGQDEVELDIEVVNAVAPQAQVVVYEGPLTFMGELDTFKKIAADNTAHVVSTSWGSCELDTAPSVINSLHAVFQQMASQGQSIFAASGDTGAYDCKGDGLGNDAALAVDYPASDPLVTGVGGTTLIPNGTETAWSRSPTTNLGSGGGLSSIYSLPSYQTGPGTKNSFSNGKRQVPDVSADADPATGYSVFIAGSWQEFGGTSAAAPLWAAITVLSNQYASAKGYGYLGQANPALYRLFNITQPYPAYHDITSGNNLFYPATTGYDLATGIGTPDAFNLVLDMNYSPQLIVNGGFENESAGWAENDGQDQFGELVNSGGAHTGLNSVWLCGYNYCDDAIWQIFKVPTNVTTVTLSYYVNVTRKGFLRTNDHFYARIYDITGGGTLIVQTLTDTPFSWRQVTFDLSSYKGHVLNLQFSADSDGTYPTTYKVDDVSVLAQ